MTNKINNVEAILAVDNKYGLAKDGKIPWNNKQDMLFFKNKTINNVVIMGSKTLLSLPRSRPLKERINVVITTNPNKYCNLYKEYNNILFVDDKQVIELLHNCYRDKTIFIIGGKQIYDMLLPYCSIIWLTKMKQNYECDLILDNDIFDKQNKNIIYDDETIEIMRLT